MDCGGPSRVPCGIIDAMTDDLNVLDFVATPNCPRDLVRLELVEGVPARWRCPECGLVRL